MSGIDLEVLVEGLGVLGQYAEVEAGDRDEEERRDREDRVEVVGDGLAEQDEAALGARVLREAGVFERMEQMGVKYGDTVSMYDLMFEYKE